MNFDIRFPIGLMFVVFGATLAIFGLASPTEIYARSLGINLNLWWGLAQLVFGLAFLWAGRKRSPAHQTPDRPETK